MNDTSVPIRTRLDWANAIRAAWQKSVAGIIETGVLLIQAKAALPYGEWLVMIKNDLPFSIRTADRLMAVARDTRISDWTHGSNLPASWRTLYELSRLDDGQWALAEQSGLIHADVERAQIENFRKRLVPVQRRESIAEPCRVVDLKRFAETGIRCGTIYADPPWRYGNQSTRGATEDHYNGLSVDEICALPVRALAAPDAHLHLWTTNAFLFDAQRVLEAWGFEYRSVYVWVKPQIGMGNYWRVSHEFLMLGVRGDAVFTDHTLRSWGEFPRRKHSQKPEEIRQLIEKSSPLGPRLELFARRKVDGWFCWGNEIERTVFDVEAA